MLGDILIQLDFTTDAPASAVWAALEAAPRWPEVLPDLVAGCIEPEGRLRAGATIRTRAKPGTAAADMAYRVIEEEAPGRLVLESGGPPLLFRARTTYSIEDEGTGCIVTVASRVRPVRWLHRLTTAFARARYSAEVRASGEARTRALLALAQEIAAERAAGLG